MTDTKPEMPRRGPRWGRVLLVASLALNLLVVGVFVGAWASRPDKAERQVRDDLRSLGIGAIGRALDKEDRRALREGFRKRRPQLGDTRRQIRESFEKIVGLVEAPALDAEALRAALQEQASLRDAAQQNIRSVGIDLLVERLAAMPEAERAAFADRLRDALERGARRR